MNPDPNPNPNRNNPNNLFDTIIFNTTFGSGDLKNITYYNGVNLLKLFT